MLGFPRNFLLISRVVTYWVLESHWHLKELFRKAWSSIIKFYTCHLLFHHLVKFPSKMVVSGFACIINLLQQLSHFVEKTIFVQLKMCVSSKAMQRTCNHNENVLGENDVLHSLWNFRWEFAKLDDEGGIRLATGELNIRFLASSNSLSYFSDQIYPFAYHQIWFQYETEHFYTVHSDIYHISLFCISQPNDQSFHSNLILLMIVPTPQPEGVFKDVPEKINANSTQLQT